MSKNSITVVEQYYAAIHAGDFEGLFNLMSPECTIEFYGPAVIPFAGIFRGKEKCRIFFNHVANDIQINEFRQDTFMTGEDEVAVTGYLDLQFLDTGRNYASDYVHVHSVHDGLLTRFRDFQNSAQAAFVCSDVSTPLR